MRYWLIAALGALTLLLVVVWWPGCRQYPAVTSQESLYLMKLLYTACNTKDMSRLKQVEAGVDKAQREGKMSASEHQAFRKIIDLANAGDWSRAERAALRFAQDQVGAGHPAPDAHDHGNHKH
jgi:hypothetical protein